MCLSQVNFLDVSFSLPNDTFKPYRKPNSETLYIDRQSNHPPTIIKQLPAMIEKRISELSCNETEFDKVKQDYQSALQRSGYNTPLRFTRPDQRRTRPRRRNIIYFKPPFNASVTTNVGKEFLQLVDKHFPPHHKYHRLFNRNTLKVSYSCSPNMRSIITSHNKSILNRTNDAPEPLACNCRNPCPMDRSGDCRLANIVYKAKVSTEDSALCKEYIGISGTEFKMRYANHKQSFATESKRDATSLSQYIWNLKERDIPYNISWSVLSKCKPYVCGSSTCNLCNALRRNSRSSNVTRRSLLTREAKLLANAGTEQNIN